MSESATHSLLLVAVAVGAVLFAYWVWRTVRGHVVQIMAVLGLARGQYRQQRADWLAGQAKNPGAAPPDRGPGQAPRRPQRPG